MASPAIGTGIGGAVIHVLFAILAHESGMAVTLVIVDKVEASPSILARVSSTFVHVDLTVVTGETRWTFALIGVRSGEATGASIQAGRSTTMINLHITIDALEFGGTFALISAIACVVATGPILAGLVGTGLGPHLAVMAVEPQGADTGVIIHSRALASSSI